MIVGGGKVEIFVQQVHLQLGGESSGNSIDDVGVVGWCWSVFEEDDAGQVLVGVGLVGVDRGVCSEAHSTAGKVLKGVGIVLGLRLEV